MDVGGPDDRQPLDAPAVLNLSRRAALGVVLAAAEPDRIAVHGRRLRFRDIDAACAVGRGGISRSKREGDGATPAGILPLRRVLYRADRVARPDTGLPAAALDPGDAWSDDPADPGYNTLVHLPRRHHAEPLWRADGLYDVLAVLGWNDDPVRPGRGSAIFLHVARPDLGPTDGCIALDRTVLLRVLAQCGPGTTAAISPT